MADKKKHKNKAADSSGTGPRAAGRHRRSVAAECGALDSFRSLIEIMPISAVIIDLEGTIRLANIHLAGMHGYGSPDDIIGMKSYDLIAPEDRNAIADTVPKILQSGHIWGERTLLRKDGTRFPAEMHVSLLRTPAGEPCGFLTTAYDVSEKRDAEKALRESEERNRLITEMSADYIFKVAVAGDGSMTMTFVSENLKTLTGRTMAEVLTSDLWSGIIHPGDREAFFSFQKNLIATGEPGELECRSFIKDGAMRWIHILARPIVDPGSGRVASIIGAIKDVTDRKMAEMRLLETQKQLEFILGVTRTGVDIIDAGFNLRYVDPAWSRLYGSFEGRKCYEYFMGRDAMCPGCGIPKALETKQVMVTEEVLVLENNRQIEVHSIPFQDERGEWVVAEFNIDITDRKKAEERIRASLEEKETLLKEIHHRVKNNLQIITSLLGLQARYQNDEHLTRQFEGAQHRIRSMALVHEKLYQSEDFGRINLESYIARLAEEVMAGSSVAERIHIRLDIDDYFISIEQAIPCGLIVNELLTNAIKYAFPLDWPGTPEIAITFRRREGNAAELAVSDNGIGVPAGIELGQTESLGLSLVSILAQQLRGAATMDRTNGSTFTVAFTLAPDDGSKQKGL